MTLTGTTQVAESELLTNKQMAESELHTDKHKWQKVSFLLICMRTQGCRGGQLQQKRGDFLTGTGRCTGWLVGGRS